MNGRPIMLLTGQGHSAVHAANRYVEALTRDRLFIIEETNITLLKSARFLYRRLRRFGILNPLDIVAGRLFRAIMLKETPCPKGYTPDLTVADVNNHVVLSHYDRLQPDWVITNGCSLLRSQTLSRITSPIINVHPGICPRYRGAGNISALCEGDFEMLGVTVHYVDKGIDSGSRIAVQGIALDDKSITLSELDSRAMDLGAALASQFVLSGTAIIPDKYNGLEDRLYYHPGLRAYLRAWWNYRRLQKAEPHAGQPGGTTKVREKGRL